METLWPRGAGEERAPQNTNVQLGNWRRGRSGGIPYLQAERDSLCPTAEEGRKEGRKFGSETSPVNQKAPEMKSSDSGDELHRCHISSSRTNLTQTLTLQFDLYNVCVSSSST